ncbi:MAG TPA: OB-fold nucleic acid binding domain-containing protein, partial [Planctomycetota bacterium]|nr:OB-fold nucleic acid binding domain-containing protein [Planctomycetota bacterium]
MSTVWEIPLRFVKGVGPARAELLKADLGLTCVGDLLTTFPRRLADRTRLREIGSLQPGERAVIQGRVERLSTHRVRRLAITEARLADETGRVTAVWFNQAYLQKTLKAGDSLVVDGAVRQYRGLQIQVREYVRADRGDGFTGWVPLYPLTEGLSQKQFRALVRSAVDRFGAEIREILPEWAL